MHPHPSPKRAPSTALPFTSIPPPPVDALRPTTVTLSRGEAAAVSERVGSAAVDACGSRQQHRAAQPPTTKTGVRCRPNDAPTPFPQVHPLDYPSLHPSSSSPATFFPLDFSNNVRYSYTKRCV